jgi:hypothetical protein
MRKGNFIKILMASVLVIANFPCSSLVSRAQSDTTSKLSATYYDIEITVGTQSAWTNKVPVTVKFKPSIDSLKTDVSWDAPIGVKVENNYTNYFATKAGQVYTVTSDLVPSKSGSFDIAVNVTAWNTDANYSNSQHFTIDFNSSLIVTPLQSGYTVGIAIKIFLIIVGIGVAGFLLYIGTKKGIKLLQAWLKPPEF